MEVQVTVTKNVACREVFKGKIMKNKSYINVNLGITTKSSVFGVADCPPPCDGCPDCPCNGGFCGKKGDLCEKYTGWKEGR